MSKYISSRLSGIKPYIPGEQPTDKKYVKLNTNENPFPPCEGALKVLNSDEGARLRLYSDPECKKLSEAVSGVYGVKSENIVFGNGSDELITFAFQAYGDIGVCFPDVTYGFYKIAAGLYNVKYEEIPLNKDFTINISDYFGVGKTVFIANPNAPTGICLSVDEIEQIVKNNASNVIVIDEAYVDFGAESCVPLIKKYDNVLVIQTFSKSRSLAGARLGMAFGNEALIADLQKIRNAGNPYNINALTQKLGIEAVLDTDYLKKCSLEISRNRDLLTRGLEERDFYVLPSMANFVFAKSENIGGEALYKGLKEKGVLVRYFSSTGDYNRITVGTSEQIKILFDKIDELKGE